MRPSVASDNRETVYMSARRPRAEVVEYDTGNDESIFTELRTKASRQGHSTMKKGGYNVLSSEVKRYPVSRVSSRPRARVDDVFVVAD